MAEGKLTGARYKVQLNIYIEKNISGRLLYQLHNLSHQNGIKLVLKGSLQVGHTTHSFS